MSRLRFPDRLFRLQAILRRKKISALLVTHPGNRRYLSGYTPADHNIQESSGVLLIPSKGDPYLLTDSRFFLQAEEEAAGYTVMLYSRGMIPCLQKLLPELDIRRLAFESHYMLHSTAGRLSVMAEELKIE